jgi:hypothetical protein
MSPRHDQNDPALRALRWVRPRMARWNAWLWTDDRPGIVMVSFVNLIMGE